jgi:hypothetical protein
MTGGMPKNGLSGIHPVPRDTYPDAHHDIARYRYTRAAVATLPVSPGFKLAIAR